MFSHMMPAMSTSHKISHPVITTDVQPHGAPLTDSLLCLLACLLTHSQMCDENPYVMPSIDESQWFTGGHLGTQIQQVG